MQTSLAEFIDQPKFPCVMAKAVMSKGYWVQAKVNTNDPAQAVCEVKPQFYQFVDRFQLHEETLSSFTVSFDHPDLKKFNVFNQFF